MKKRYCLFIVIYIGFVIIVGIIILRFVLLSSVFTNLAYPSDRLTLSPTVWKDTSAVTIIYETPVPEPLAFQMNDDWSYLKGTQDPPADWNKPGFDDSNWLVGKPGFGYGDHDDTTVLDDMQDNYLSVFIRNEFYLTDPKMVSPLILSIDYDDGFVAYVNGVELTRRNLKGDPPSYNQPAISDYETGIPEKIYLDHSLLQVGENVIAIQVHNKTIDNSDLSLIANLKQSHLPIELGKYWRYFKGSQEPPSDWNQADFDDSNWILGASGFGYEDKDDATRITDMRGRYLSIYTRNNFFVEDPGMVGTLTLEVDYDDGFVAYLNGTEIWRRNLSGDPPEFNTPADGNREAGTPDFIHINPTLLKAGNNTLAIQIHNESKNSTDLTLRAALRQSGPYLQNVEQDTITIMWESYGDPLVGKVRYREQGDLIWRETYYTESENIHEVKLTGFKSSDSYEYQVNQGDYKNWIPGNPATFNTAPDPTGSYSFVVYGDSRTYTDRHLMVVESIINNDPDLVINVGDLVDAGRNYALWGSQFFGPLANLMIDTPLYPAIGNHELEGSGRLWYTDFFSLPGNERWYAFSYGCSRVIVLDSNVDFSPKSAQYTWLLDELESEEYQDSKWQVVTLHHPPFTSGTHKSDDKPVVDYLVPLFEQYGVDFVLTGHNHHYERSQHNQIYYIVTGGGGAELYDFPNTKLNPDSQVRNEVYHHVTLDFSCSEGKVEYKAWNIWNQVIDGPIEIME